MIGNRAAVPLVNKFRWGKCRLMPNSSPTSPWHYGRNFGCACFFPTILHTGMNLTSLLVCSDDRAVRILRNVLGELEIHVEHCADTLSATNKLAQHSFEAVIIDCNDERSFGLLKSVRSGQQNRKSVAIAIIDARTNLQTAFKLGANFVVYKPISTEKAKSSFRAARALLKRERRRSVRLEVNIPAYFRFQDGEGEQASISGLSEGGLSVRLANSPGKKSGLIAFSFALPDTTTVIEATGTIAWQDSRCRVGIQFATPSEPRPPGRRAGASSRGGFRQDARKSSAHGSPIRPGDRVLEPDVGASPSIGTV